MGNQMDNQLIKAWLVIAIVSGSAIGDIDEQTIREVEDPHAPAATFEAIPTGDEPDQQPDVVNHEPVESIDVIDPAEPVEQVQALDEPVDEASMEHATDMVDPTQPSLVGIDRSGWSTLRVGPASGVTYHQPVYYGDAILSPTEASVDFNAPVHKQIEAALKHTRTGGWNCSNSVGFFSDPVQFAIDTISIPILQLSEPVYEEQTTPP